MWNSKTLKPPPMCEMKVQLTPACKDTLNIARLCATQACKPLQDHLRLFEAELYVTKRIIYKFSDQFRSDKALKSLRQVYTCLKRLEVLDLLKQLTEFGESVGRIAFDDDHSVYLPSRQCFEYQLVRLQGAGALLRQTANYSQQTFIYVREYLKVGNMVSQNVVMLAICSRIWYVSNSLCQYVCKWYSKFYNCLTYLKPTAVPWLRDGETIPSDITQWLKEMFEDSQLTQEDSEFVEQIASNNNTIDMVESETTVVSSVEVPSNKPTQKEDIGEVIQRSAVRKVITKMNNQSPGFKQNQSKGKRKAESSNLDNSDEYLSLTKVPRVHNNSSDEDESQSSDESFDLTENTKADEKEFDKQERSEVIGKSNGKFQTREKKSTSNKVDTTSGKARFNDRINSVEEVEGVLEQIRDGSIEFNGKVINLADHKIVHVMKAIGKIKKRLEGNMTGLMGQQMYVKKVKQYLNKILWNVSKSNNITKTSQGSNKVHSRVNLNESETAVLSSPGIRQRPITDSSPVVGKEAKNNKKKKKKKKKSKGDSTAEKTDEVRPVTVNERGDNDSSSTKTTKKTKKRKKNKKNKSGQ